MGATNARHDGPPRRGGWDRADSRYGQVIGSRLAASPQTDEVFARADGGGQWSALSSRAGAEGAVEFLGRVAAGVGGRVGAVEEQLVAVVDDGSSSETGSVSWSKWA